MSDDIVYFKFGLQYQHFLFRSILDGPDKETIAFEKEPWMEYVLTSKAYPIEFLKKGGIQHILDTFHIRLDESLKPLEECLWDRATYLHIDGTRNELKRNGGYIDKYPYITYYQFTDYYKKEALLNVYNEYQINTEKVFLVYKNLLGNSGFPKYELGFIEKRGTSE